ncbi:MarR family winged helix-turn-helix transcriptional regulator [Pseudactinotalea sp. HY160]|uniref:MarR family winged helix-turn-helix transcriptional regulator n=1 Tax=Pseudactinotalea sp. HY160 TaxID=2654490 RepID=UPI00351B2E4B
MSVATGLDRPPTPRAASAAWEALLRAQASLMAGFEAGGDFDPLSAREYDVLFRLAGAPGGRLAMRELVTGALVSQPGISRLVDRLTAAGLTRREPDARDGRAIVVVLTPRGRALQRELGRRHVRSITARLAPLSEREARLLQALCTRLTDALAVPDHADRPDRTAWEDAS